MRRSLLTAALFLCGCPDEKPPRPPVVYVPKPTVKWDAGEQGDPIPGKLVMRSPREITREEVTAMIGAEHAEVEVLCLPATQDDGGLGGACRIKMQRKDGATDLAWTTQMRDLLRGMPGADAVDLYTLPK